MFQHFNETASLLDISSIFHYVNLLSKVDVKAKDAQMSDSDLDYQIFCFKVLRVEPRFELRMQVNLQPCHLENLDSMAGETPDFSRIIFLVLKQGMQFLLNLPAGMRLSPKVC